MRSKGVSIVKHTALVGIAVLCTPLAGCGTLDLFNSLIDNDKQVQALAAVKQPPAQPDVAVPSDVQSAIKAAQDARKNGEFGIATKILSQTMLVAPDNPQVLGEYGKTLAAQGRSDDALAFLERATQLQPGDWTLFSAQGVAYDQKGIYRAAQASYEHALSLKPDEPTVLNNDALSHLQSGDVDGAERLLRSAGPAAQSDPRIAKNLELVQSVRAARAEKEKPAPVAEAVTPAAVPAPAVAQDPTPATPPQNLVPVAQAATPPSQTEAVAAPLPAEPPVEAVALASPPPAPALEQSRPQETASIEVPKADPTVVMQHVPADRSSEIPPPAPRKPAVAAPQPEKKIERPANAAPAAQPVAPAVRVAAASKSYFVQAGAFGSEAGAGKAASGLESIGARVMPGNAADGHAVYRVRIGPFLNRQQASVAVGQAHDLGHADVIIVAE